MKKLTALLILLLYLASTVGVGVEAFYCCGELTSISASLHEEPNKKAVDGDGCCQSKYQFHKIKDTHQHSHTVAFAFGHVATLPAFPVYSADLVYTEATSFTAHRAKAPPSPGDVPLYIYHCTYRI